MPLIVTSSGPEIPDDATADEKINNMLGRIRRLERTSKDHHVQCIEEARSVREEIGRVAGRLQQADEDLEELARVAATSTAQLQLAGLMLVVVGAVIQALPPLLRL